MGRIMKGELTMAVRMLRRNKGRSILTMVGIIIGVASVITVVGIGQGVEQQISQQTQRLGKDLITVRPGQFAGRSDASFLGSIGQLSTVSASSVLSSDDVASVRKTPDVAAAIPLSLVSGGVTSGETDKHYTAPVVGSDPGLPEMVNQSLTYGAFFDPNQNADDKVVLGANIAQTLFDINVPLGQTVTILGHQFIVTGIFSEFQTPPLSTDIDFNNAVFITNDEAQIITNGHATTYEILVRPANHAAAGKVASALTTMLLRAHGGQHDFSVLMQGQTTLVVAAILQLMTTLVIGVAAISLLVGGIGIMNVMLVSVTERMHEIGIRKAIGATNQQILRQFVVEAAVLSVAGAAAGVVFSLFLIAGLALFTDLAPMFVWQVALAACFVSVLIGLLFGAAPALKAARKQPISALRND